MARRKVQSDTPEQIAKALQDGDDRLLARTLTLVENQLPGCEQLLDALYPSVGSAWRVGLTGPPGAGKSTIASQLTKRFLSEGRSIAYVGVDPSSPFSGGALLGDRVRITNDESGRFFARSLATRGAQGGLSGQTEAAVDVFDAAGFDVVIVESVGVGQAEIDISQIVDTVVVVLVPESGDEIQALKAGLLEVGDVLCVNKADRSNAHALVSALRTSLTMRFGPKREWEVPIVSTVALTENIEALAEALARHEAYLRSSGLWLAARRSRLRRRIRSVVTDRWLQSFWTDERTEILERALEDIDDTMPHPYAIAQRIISSKPNE